MRYLSIFLFSLLLWTGCRDDEFDAPPTIFEDPDIESNTSIAELKAMNVLGDFDEITDDIIIEGIITADDRSGNFYSELIIQDETGGISIAMDANDLFNFYPVGRRVFVKCQGLWIGDNRGSQQIGGGTELNGNFTNISRLPEALFGQFIFPGALVGQPEPVEKTLSELSPADYNLLVKLKDVEIAPSLVGTPYANAGGGSGVNQTVVDCDGNSVIMRNSDFATWAGELMPGGNGELVCIYTVFVNDPQIKFRETEDLMFNNPSCNGSVDCDVVSVAGLRECFSGSEGPAPSGTIQGIVISDRAANNINFQNIVLQDGNRGIVLRFTAEHSFNLGDELSVNIAGGLLGEYNGLLQVSELEGSAASVTSTGNNVTPNVVTIDALSSNSENLESTLIQINDVSFSGSTWGDGVTVSDGTGSISIYTFFSASFSGESVPATADNIVAIVSQFNDVQLNLRNASDINGGGGMTGGDPVLVSIESIQDLWSGSTTTISGDKKIEGVVISDNTNGNITSRNLIMQNGNAGIVVRFTADHSYALGDNIEVIVTGQELSDYNGLVQVNNVPNSNASNTGGSVSITPAVVSIATLLASPEAYESTLVILNGVTISGSTTFNGNTTVSDGSDEIIMYTRSDASFSGTSLPSGAVNLTAVVSDFNGVQINIRSMADIN